MADKPGSQDHNNSSDAERDFREDISRIANGAKQINHAAFSATRGEQREAAVSAQRAENKSSSLDALTRMAQWDAQRTVIAGVEMTNAEAQAARLCVIENGDQYAKWAVERGYIRAGQEEEFKDTAKRMYELKQAERENGGLTAGQQREWDDLESSGMGQAANEATAAAHRDMGPSINVDQSRASKAREIGPSQFPVAPPVNACFTNAATCEAAPDPKNAPASPAPKRDNGLTF